MDIVVVEGVGLGQDEAIPQEELAVGLETVVVEDLLAGAAGVSTDQLAALGVR